MKNYKERCDKINKSNELLVLVVVVVAVVAAVALIFKLQATEYLYLLILLFGQISFHIDKFHAKKLQSPWDSNFLRPN